MSAVRRVGYGWPAWLIGFAVLAALGAAVAMMFHHTMRAYDQPADAGPASAAARDVGAEVVGAPKIQQLEVRQQVAEGFAGEMIRGVVLHPDGRPIATATVTLHRLVTAWPEWRTEPIEEALTDESGAFRFRAERRSGHLLAFEHARFAGDLVEVPLHGGAVKLELRPQFEVFGQVVNDSGVPVSNARVALEAVPGEQRRARVTYTSADGRYEFPNVAAGPARLVAHHESWQPTTAPAFVVGDRKLVDLRFERPTMSPLRGRVVDVATQRGIDGATVQLVPINQELGLVAPIEVVTDAAGDFLLQGLPRGSMRLLVRHPRHGTVQRTQTIGAVAQDLTIELPARSLVGGALVAAAGGDRAWRGGEVLELTDVAGEVHYAAVGEDGRFRFVGAVSPGWATVRVVGREFAFRSTSLASVSALVRERDETELELVVTAPSTLRGRFVDEQGAPVAGVKVMQTRLLSESAKRIGDAAWQMDIGAVGSQFARLFGFERDKLLAVSDEQGRFEVRGFRVGGLLARCVREGYGSRWLNLQVPQPGELRALDDTVLRRGCELSGVVLRGRRPFAGASVAAIGAECQGIAVTDRSGRYVIRDLEPGTYSVRARITGQSTGSDEEVVEVAPTRPARGVNIRLEIGRTVQGLVTSQGGQPLPGAIVSMRGARGLVAATDSVGRFSLDVPNRPVELRVSLGDRSRHEVVQVALGQSSVEVQLDTPPKCTLRGSVFGLPGQRRMLGARLRVTMLGEGDERSTRWVELPDGELEWNLCPSGDVRVEIWCDGYAPFVTERTLAPNEPHDLGQVLLEPGARLAGVVRDEDGAFVDGATVLLGDEADLDLYEPAVRSDAAGRFVMQGVTSRSSQLVVRAPGFAASTIDLQLPGDVLSATPLEVVLERGATIEVHVPRRGRPEGGLVQLRRRGRLLATGELDERGRVWFANRSAGDYTVELFSGEREPQSVRVAPGAKLVRVELLAGS